VVATGEDLAHDPQLAARNFLIDTHHPYLPHTLLPGCPIALSDTPATYSRHAPLLGQDNYDIICNLLGFSESEYEYFDRCGVLS
jgi:crotonobetainyl-CoA:carnitine CoA-transferase CaiB-like acyl-CoA transferase